MTNEEKAKEIIGGGVYSVYTTVYHTYIYGDITPEMADDMKPRSTMKTYFEYKQ